MDDMIPNAPEYKAIARRSYTKVNARSEWDKLDELMVQVQALTIVVNALADEHRRSSQQRTARPKAKAAVKEPTKQDKSEGE